MTIRARTVALPLSSFASSRLSDSYGCWHAQNSERTHDVEKGTGNAGRKCITLVTSKIPEIMYKMHDKGHSELLLELGIERRRYVAQDVIR